MKQNVLGGVILLMIVLGVQALTSMDRAGGVLISTVPGVLIVAGILAYLASGRLKREQDRWVSYQLTMSPNVLRRHIDGLPAIEVLRDEVTAITSTTDGSLNVMSTDPHRFVHIPSQLVGFSEVRTRLIEWKPIAPENPKRSKAKQTATSMVVLAVWFVASTTSNTWVSVGGGVLLLGYAIWAEREISRSLTMDEGTKRRTQWMFRFFALGPFLRLLFPVLTSFVQPQP